MLSIVDEEGNIFPGVKQQLLTLIFQRRSTSGKKIPFIIQRELNLELNSNMKPLQQSVNIRGTLMPLKDILKLCQ